MGRIVFVWEFGGGFGHIEGILPLAKTLQERGHDIVCIMKYVINAEKILGQYGIKVIQAPVFWEVNVNALPDTFNYAENLFNLGYPEDGDLLSMVKAWLNQFELLKPDLIVVDHAPTALIAARIAKIKTVLYGTGYFSPPKQSPMPSLIPWVKAPEGRLKYFEKKALKTINSALSQLEAPPLERLADLFDVDENILTTFKELDHYESRESTKYWGPVISLPKGITPCWSENFKHKIFCYLKPNNPHFKPLLHALSQIAADIIIYAPGTPKDIIIKTQSSSLVFLHEPANMHEACEKCDLVICHAGHGTIALSLLHGKPLVVFPWPNHLEQVLTSRNVSLLKAGVTVIKVLRSFEDYKRAILMVLSDSQFLEQAQNFANKYNDFKPELQIAEIADRCEELINIVK